MTAIEQAIQFYYCVSLYSWKINAMFEQLARGLPVAKTNWEQLLCFMLKRGKGQHAFVRAGKWEKASSSNNGQDSSYHPT